MRYLNVPTVTFVDARGRKVRVKDMLEIEQRPTGYIVDRTSGEPMDAIAARLDVFGDGGERRAWELHHMMAVEIVDRKFDYSRLLQIRVPQV